VFPVLDTGTTIDVDGAGWPTVVIDASDHPEIRDLPRVHAVEGVGDIRTEALRIPGATGDLLLLGVRITRPVHCAFALAFGLPGQQHVLLEAAEAGHLMVATTPPSQVTSNRPLWLAIDLDRDAIRAAVG
jgi:hypothetical protein